MTFRHPALLLVGAAGLLAAPLMAQAIPAWMMALSALGLLVAGLAMRSWLLPTSGNATAALVGAIAYMAAPYHLFALYRRGDLAELAGYALLPLVMLAIRRTTEGWRWDLPLLAASFGGLVLAQPPTALLCAVGVLSPFALLCTRSPARLLLCAGGAALGVGLAAFGLVPVSAVPSLSEADHWLVLAPERWRDPVMMQTFTSIALALAVLLAGLCIALLQMPLADGRRTALGFWIAIGLGALVLLVGLAPAFWTLPVLAAVEFPGRLMMVVEFAAITALCLVPLARLRRVVVYFFAAAAVALVPAAVSVAADLVAGGGRGRASASVPQVWTAAAVEPGRWAISGLSLLILAGLMVYPRRAD